MDGWWASLWTARAIAYRERRGLPWLETLVGDVAYSLRRLRRRPAATAIAVLSIGLGIGANGTIFSMVSRFVLRPAPVGDPGTLMSLHTTHDGDRCCNSFPFPVYTDVRDQTHSFSGVAAYYELLPASIGGKGEPERVWGQSATSNFFDVSQIHMHLGRGFLATEERSPVIVLSHRLWRRRFDVAAHPPITRQVPAVDSKTRMLLEWLEQCLMRPRVLWAFLRREALPRSTAS